MQLEKVIEVLTVEKAIATRTGQPVLYAALQLGIEALKAWREARKDPDFTIAPVLPGETEE